MRHRLENLFFERDGSPVPKKGGRPADVDDGHGIADALGTGDAGAVGIGIREPG